MQNMVFDKDVVYNREHKEIKLYDKYQKYPNINWLKYKDYNRDTYINFIYIGFCGKVYTVAQCVDKQTRYIYSSNTFEEYLETFQPGYKKYHTGHIPTLPVMAQSSNKYSNIFTEYKVPVFKVEATSERVDCGKISRTLTLNCNLSLLEFYKVKDTQTCFQDIYQYLSGVLGLVDKKIPNVSDQDMLEAKGFDKRYSFRKDKKQ